MGVCQRDTPALQHPSKIALELDNEMSRKLSIRGGLFRFWRFWRDVFGKKRGNSWIFTKKVVPLQPNLKI